MAKKANRHQRSQTSIRKEAEALLGDNRFLYRGMTKTGELGLVGEKKNRLRLILSGLTKDHGQPVSVLVKGTTSSGKSNLLRTVIKLFPPESVIPLTSQSEKAPVYGKGSLDGKILFVSEYRGTKAAQFLIRLQQSEGVITHEHTIVAGQHRETQVSERVGMPVVWTSTTQDRVFPDDETRSLSIDTDESSKQTLAIVQAEICKARKPAELPLVVWHEAIRVLGEYKKEVIFPDWFGYVANQLPIEQVRVRRDWPRFIAFCKVIALCRSWSDPEKQSRKITFKFSDYCVAYRILATAFEATVHEVPSRELSIAREVRKLSKKLKRAVTVQEVAKRLRWRIELVYKYVPRAVKHSLIKYEDGTKAKNLKRLLPVPGLRTRFLPTPESVFENNPQTGDAVSYIDPVTGHEIALKRANKLNKHRSPRRAHER